MKILRKAIPPDNIRPAEYVETWKRELDNYDRTIRRINSRFRKRVVRLSPEYVGTINSARYLPLEILNRLPDAKKDQ